MCSGIQFKLDYDGLSRRIHRAKQASGMKRAQSKLSLLGETRTFAEVLDEEVEKMVLNYIKEQGSIAGMTWELRSTQLAKLLNPATPLSVIEDLLVRYRALGSDVLHLLECLDANVLALRKIIQLHDSCFDQNLAAMYFGTSKGKFLKNTQLFPFHHQDGIRAIMSTIKRGFEDLHDAKNALEGGGMRAVCNSAGFDGGTRQIPRISFGNRLASMSNLNAMFEQPQLIASAPVRAKSMSNVFSGLRSGPQMVAQEEVSVTVLEPILQQIEATAKRVLITQHQTFVDVIAGNSEMALELSLDDLPGSPIKADLRRIPKEQRRFSAHEVGLFINLFVTFVYLANQYVVAPTSGEYARLVGMTPAMSGVIIGLCPAAALVSSLLYSAWSNHSFKQPLLACIACGILGNILYGAALQCNSANMLILGRLLTGFGGPRVISRRYIADHVPAEKRLLASSAFVTAGAMGLASGPLISSLVELSGVTFQWHAFGGNVIWYQPETAPGWIMAVLWLAALVLVIPFFVEPNEQV